MSARRSRLRHRRPLAPGRATSRAALGAVVLLGGSGIAQVDYYGPRIVAPYRPRAIVPYAGDDDTAGEASRPEPEQP